MREWQQRQSTDEQEDAVHETRERAKPPRVYADAGKDEVIQECEQPAANGVSSEPQHKGEAPIAGKEGADQEWQAQPGKTETLAALKNCGHRDGRDKTPQDQITERGVRQTSHSYSFP